MTRYASGHAARVSRFTTGDGSAKERRTWSFSKRPVSIAEHVALEGFFEDHDGVEQSFYYVEPDDASQTQIKVVFAQDELRRAKVAPDTYATAFDLVEVF